MKATGIVRKVDKLKRLVIPIELCRTLGIKDKDPMEIFVSGQDIIIRKYEPLCCFCGHGHEAQEYKGKIVCPKCAKEIAKVVV